MDNSKLCAIEISLSFGELEDFEHEGYYDNIDEAIEALQRLKKYYEPSPVTLKDALQFATYNGIEQYAVDYTINDDIYSYIDKDGNTVFGLKKYLNGKDN